MKNYLLLIGISIMLFSCSTLQLSEENKQFESDTGASILYSLRGLQSLESTYNYDPNYSMMKKLVEEGNVTLISSDSGKERAFIEKDKMGNYTISIDNVFSYYYYDYATKMAYLTAILATAAKMEIITSESQNNELLKQRFYEIIDMYKKYYTTVSFAGDTWFTDKKMIVDGNYIY